MPVSLNWPEAPFSLLPGRLPDVAFPRLNEALNALDPFLPQMLRDKFVSSRNGLGCPILAVPPDLWVDYIFPTFTVEDVIALRQTCKAFYLLTQEPCIWRRFLENVQFPVPPLRPTWRYGFKITDYEIEHLVTQAISVEDNWRRPEGPKIYNERIVSSELLVNEVYIVPGGRYLLVSCMDREKPTPPDRVRCYLYLYMLDHPNGPAAVCRVPTFLRAYNIQAKYVQMRVGETGLLITYNRRKVRLPQPPAFHEEDLSTEFEHRHDVVGGFDFNIAVLYVNLSMVEWLKQPDIDHTHPSYREYLLRVPNPFRELGMVNSPFEITQTSIVKWNDKHWVSFIALPHELHFVNVLDPQEHIIAALRGHQSDEWRDFPHRLRAFRVYPNQDDMVVIRTIGLRSHTPAQLQRLATPTATRGPIIPTGGEREIHLIEWYKLPIATRGVVSLSCTTRYLFDKNKTVNKFVISDLGWPNRKKVAEEHPTLKHTLGGPPPPVSIFMELAKPYGIEHHQIFPTQLYKPPTPEHPGYYRYQFDHTSFPMHTTYTDPHRPKVLPGSESALVCLIREGDITATPRLAKMRRYMRSGNIGPEYFPDYALQEQDDPACPVTRRGKRLPLPTGAQVYADFSAAQSIVDKVNANGGLRSIAWDETTGRIVIASDREEFMRIVDTAAGVVPDGRTEHWKRQREWLHEDLGREQERAKMMDPDLYKRMPDGTYQMQVD